MSAPAETLPHALAIQGAIAATGLSTFLGEAGKDGNGVRVAPPYVIVHIAGAGVRSMTGLDRGVLADPNKDADVAFQTTAVGENVEQALNVQDRVVAALLGASPTVAGRTTVKPIVLDEDPDTVRRDDTAAEALFYAVARWTWRTSA